MQKAVELVCGGLTLRGMLHIPDNGKNKHPFVAMYHGFTGSNTEASFMFVQLSRELEKAGIGSIRFDFSGSGNSDGVFEDMTLTSEANEAKCIFEYMSQLEFVDRDNLFMLGMSMGGLVTSITAGELSNVKAVVLWAPAGNMADLAETFSKDAPVDENGRADMGGVLLNTNFISDIRSRDIFSLASKYKGDLLIIHGTKDTTVPIQTSYKYLEAYGGRARLVEVDGADHCFGRVEWRRVLIPETVSFFAGKVRI